MNNNQQLITSEARDINPKAVFYGPSNELLTKLALYLTKWNVELFAGKELADAFYGDYFFYIGNQNNISSWLKKKHKDLPRTLLLLTDEKADKDFSDLLKDLDNCKAVLINNKQEFSDQDIEKIMSFYMGSKDKFMEFSHTQAPKKQLETEKEEEKEHSDMTEKKAETSVDLDSLKNNNMGLQQATLEVVKTDENENKENTEKEPVEAEKTLEDLFHTRPKESGGNTHNIKKGLNLKIKLPIISLAITTIILLVFLPLLIFILSVLITGINFYQAKNNFNNANYKAVVNNLSQAQTYTQLGKRSLNFSSWILNIFHLTDLKNQLYGAVDLSQNLTYGLSDLAKVAIDGQSLYQKVVSGQPADDLIQLISTMKGNLVLANSYLSVAEAESKTPAVSSLMSNMKLSFLKDLSKTPKFLSDLRVNSMFASNALSIAAEAMGASTDKTYLIVFQNNMELRPTGGFIGSYGLAKFTGGSLKEFNVNDVYTADGALKGHVDPPEPIKTYLHQEHWYMRDSNWDPDFTKSAKQLVWFLEKEIDVRVDGVVAVDLQLAKELLNIIGPIKLADYNETIDADNLFTKANEFILTDNFPGSTQKKDFLSSLARVMQEKLTTDKNITGLDVLKLMHKSLLEKHLQLYFTDNNIEQLISGWGWSGQVNISEICPEGQCQPDFIQIVDANLGVNKSNFYVKRSIESSITLDNEAAKHNLIIKYQNDSPANQVGEGNYRNYLRVRIPNQNQLTESRIDSLPLKITNATLASSSAVTEAIFDNYKEISILIDVPAQTTKTLNLSFNQSLNNSANQFNYTYRVFKQPGTLADGLTVNVKFPGTWKVIELNPLLADNEKFTYNTDLSQDRTFEMKFSR